MCCLGVGRARRCQGMAWLGDCTTTSHPRRRRHLRLHHHHHHPILFLPTEFLIGRLLQSIVLNCGNICPLTVCPSQRFPACFGYRPPPQTTLNAPSFAITVHRESESSSYRPSPWRGLRLRLGGFILRPLPCTVRTSTATNRIHHRADRAESAVLRPSVNRYCRRRARGRRDSLVTRLRLAQSAANWPALPFKASLPHLHLFLQSNLARLILRVLRISSTNPRNLTTTYPLRPLLDAF
jgi:hypothetical protein